MRPPRRRWSYGGQAQAMGPPCFLLVLLAGFSPGQELPAGPGKDVFEAICSSCHAPTHVFEKALTKAEWEKLVNEMLQESDIGTTAKQDIVEYLARFFPPKVNVNQASAADLAKTLDLTAEQAGALVAHRVANGPFKSFEDLKKVLEAGKLEAAKNRIAF